MVRNNAIWIWRILFTYAIAVYHLNNAYNVNSGWYIWVEFFFIVSGFLLMKKVCEDEKVTCWGYTLSRVCYFLPIIFLNSMIRLLYDAWVNGKTWKWILYRAFESVPDYLMIYLFGGSDSLNPVAWYINALVAGGCIIVYLLLYHRRLYLNVIAPFSAVIIYGWIVKYTGCIEGFGANNSPLRGGANYFYLLRGFAGLSIGVLVYTCSGWLLEVRKSRKIDIILKAMELLGYLFVAILAFRYGRRQVDFVYLLILAICVGLSFSHGLPEGIIKNRIIQWLNHICVYIYLSHYVVRLYFASHLDYSGMNVLLYCIVVTLLSAVEYILVQKARLSGRRWIQWIKNKEI